MKKIVCLDNKFYTHCVRVDAIDKFVIWYVAIACCKGVWVGSNDRSGARPTNDIWIEFEIRSKFWVL